jgi:hypothetical protein
MQPIPANQFEKLLQQACHLCQNPKLLEGQEMWTGWVRAALTLIPLSARQANQLWDVITSNLLSEHLYQQYPSCWKLWLEVLQKLTALMELRETSKALGLLKKLHGCDTTPEMRASVYQLLDTLLTQEGPGSGARVGLNLTIDPLYDFIEDGEETLLQEEWEKLVALLLKHGADLDAHDGEGGMTVLHYSLSLACEEIGGYKQAIIHLLKLGARVNQVDDAGMNPLMHFARQNMEHEGDEELFDMLLERGTDLSQRDRQGHDIIHHLRIFRIRKDGNTESWMQWKMKDSQGWISDSKTRTKCLQKVRDRMRHKDLLQHCHTAVVLRPPHGIDYKSARKSWYFAV